MGDSSQGHVLRQASGLIEGFRMTTPAKPYERAPIGSPVVMRVGLVGGGSEVGELDGGELRPRCLGSLRWSDLALTPSGSVLSQKRREVVRQLEPEVFEQLEGRDHC